MDSINRSEILSIINNMKLLLTCPICASIMINPISLNCHHHMCNECFNNLNNKDNICPLCNVVYWKNDIKINKSYRNIIDAVNSISLYLEPLVNENDISCKLNLNDNVPTNNLNNNILLQSNNSSSPIKLNIATLSSYPTSSLLNTQDLIDTSNILKRAKKMYGIGSINTLDLDSSGVDMETNLNETINSAQIDVNDNITEKSNEETHDMNLHIASEQDMTLEPSPLQLTTSKVTHKEIMFTGLSELSQGILNSTIKMLGYSNLQTDKHVTTTTTHMVVSVDDNMLTKRTMKYMEALGRGIWIVSWNWVVDSKAANSWKDEFEYEIKGDTTTGASFAATRSRHRQTELFYNVKFILFNAPTLSNEPTIDQMKYLINCGGGSLINESEMNTLDSNDKVYIIASASQKNQGLKFKFPILTPSWIIHCLSGFNLIDIGPHQLS